jgi:hypothetical protein
MASRGTGAIGTQVTCIGEANVSAELLRLGKCCRAAPFQLRCTLPIGAVYRMPTAGHLLSLAHSTAAPAYEEMAESPASSLQVMSFSHCTFDDVISRLKGARKS